jgi:Glycosyl hydrolases family 2, sugar binding domain/Glycosyl hydrolases family 2, TIM barrel domain
MADQDDRGPMTRGELDRLIDGGYPRPQLARRHWVDLCGRWEFTVDDVDEGRQLGWGRDGTVPFGQAIDVPYPPESALSGVCDRGFHPVVWYRRRFAAPPLADSDRLLLHFGAVDYAAQVWVNGLFVGGHEGGHTPFSFDITEAAGPGGRGVLVVRAQDDPADAHQPRGKQDWRPAPHRIWYHRTTGIWQPVWLEAVPRCHLAGVSWQADVAAGRVSADVTLSRDPSPGSTLRVRLLLGTEMLAEQCTVVHARHHRVHLAVPATENAWDWDRLQWSPGSPTLIGADLELTEPVARTTDHVSSYLGLRSVEVADGHFLLNGHPCFLRLALEQGYWPRSHLAAPGPAALRAEVELAKSLGFNGLRVHQKVEDPRFLYWADRLGLLVWTEMPSPAGFSARATRRLVGEWQEVIERDRSHPCVVAWVPFNESWGVPAMSVQPAQRHLVAALYHLTRSLDPTRPVISNDGWEHVEGDIWTVHDYAPSGQSLTERYGSRAAIAATLAERWPGPHRVVPGGAIDRGQPVVLSEFGGLTYAPRSGDVWRGYGTVQSAEELAGRLDELVGAVCASDGLAGFCYTQLTDTEQERNGLTYADRTPKLPAQRLRAIFTRPSRAVPTEEVAAARHHDGGPAARAAGRSGKAARRRSPGSEGGG